MTGQIKIEGTVYPLKFGYGALKRLGIMWGEESMDGIFSRFTNAFKELEKDPKFEHIDVIGQMTLAGILNADPSVDLDSDAIVQDIMFNNNFEKMQIVSQLFVDSMPKNVKDNAAVKKKPAKKTARKKA